MYAMLYNSCQRAPCAVITTTTSTLFSRFLQPAPGAFAYDQAAYTAALEQLVEALPIRKPLTLVVHVRRDLHSQTLVHDCVHTCLSPRRALC